MNTSDTFFYWTKVALVAAGTLIFLGILAAVIATKIRDRRDAREEQEAVERGEITGAETWSPAEVVTAQPVSAATIAALQERTVAMYVLDRVDIDLLGICRRHDVEWRDLRSLRREMWEGVLHWADADFQRALERAGCTPEEIRVLTARATAGRVDVTGSWTEEDQAELDELLAAEAGVR